MSKARLNVINQAFDKLDKTKDGVVTVEDLRLLYNVEHHPKYKSGQMTRDQILKQFMDTFQQGGVMDDTVRHLNLASRTKYNFQFARCR
jgi:Ca2+-binding EF-hand superfamily protein